MPRCVHLAIRKTAHRYAHAIPTSLVTDNPASRSHLCSGKDVNLSWLGDRCYIEVDVNGAAGNQHVDFVWLRDPASPFQQVQQVYSRFCFDRTKKLPDSLYLRDSQIQIADSPPETGDFAGEPS